MTSAIWERQEFPVQRMSTVFMLDFPGLKTSIDLAKIG
jgi:hypothetical protein